MTDDIARLGYEIDSTQALSAARNLLTMEQAAGRAATGAAKLTTRFRDANGRFISAARGVAENSREIEMLASKYNSAMSAELAFANAQKEVSRAVQLGVISAGQADTALEVLQQQYLASGNAAQVLGAKVGASNRHILNMGFQFQDIGMMMASGQNPLILAMQQGAQVSGIFNQMRMEGQKIGPALLGGITQLINPLSLVTIGAIAAGAALVQWGMSALGASDDTQTFTEATDDLVSAMDRYRTAISDSEQLTTQLLEMYGTQAQAMQTTLQLIARLERIRFTNAIAQGVADLRVEFSDLSWYIDRVNQFVGTLEETGPVSARALRGLNDQFGLTLPQAEALRAQLDYLASSPGPVETATALERVSNILITAQENGATVSDELLTVVADALRAAQAARELAGALGDAAGNAAAIQIPLGMDTGGGWVFDPNSDMPPAAHNVGRGGGGQSEAERLAEDYKQRLDALRLALQTERETIDEWYSNNLADLNDRRANELLTQADHNEMRLALEREYQERLIALRGDYNGTGIEQTQKFMGDMASALQGGNERMQRIASVFAGIEATINAYRAFNQVLADPTLPWFAKIPAAVTVLAAGLRTVAAIRGGGSGGGGSGGSGLASSGSTVSGGSQRTVLVTFDGPDWAKEMFQSWTDQLYEAAGDGKVIIK